MKPMKKPDFKLLFPYFAAISIFVIITMVYFSPLLEGKKILQSDIVNFRGMSKEIVDYRNQTGEEPLWTNSMFGGMPAYQISVEHYGFLHGFIGKIITLGLPHPANYVFLYFLGFFLLLIVMRVNPWLAAAGAIGFAFSSYFFIIIEAGHNSKAHAISLLPFVMAGIILTMQKRYLWGGLMTAIFLSLQVKANHPQITYYFAMIVLLYGLFELIRAIREKEIGSFSLSAGVLLLAAMFAVMTNLTSLWSTWEYGKYTIRGKSELTSDQGNRTSGLDKDYATQWSYGRAETMTLLIPDFHGGSSTVKVSENSAIGKALKDNGVSQENIRQFIGQPLPFLYWGDQPFTSGPVYAGAIMVFLFMLGLLIVRGPVKWWLLTSVILSILLAWGHNLMGFTEFFMHYVPGYNKFRAVTMILVIAEFCIPLLGILAVKELTDCSLRDKKLMQRFYIAFAVTAGATLLFALAPGIFLNFTAQNDPLIQQQYQLPEWLMQAIRDERMNMVKSDAFRSFIFITLAAGILWIMLSGKVKKEYAFITIGILILADMFPVNKRYLNNDSFTTPSRVEVPYTPTRADEEILQDKDPNFRVLNLTVNTFNDASTSYFHKSIGGYHGAKLRRYQELIDHGIRNEIEVFSSSISTDNTPVLNMLNTKYLIVPDQERRPVPFPNRNALGNAWFVKAFILVDNADAEIAAMQGFRPDSVAVVDKSFSSEIKGFEPHFDSTDQIILEQYKPNYLKYLAHSKNGGLAVFSEIYYPAGWNAYVDEEPASHFRVNYVLRGMVLPAGKHTVEFRFEPTVYHAGEKISMVSSALLLLLLAGGIVYEYLCRRKSRA